MTISTRTHIAVAATALVVIAAPTAAQAFQVGYSSDRGRGDGQITWTGTKNFRYDVTVRSSTGARVYSSYRGVRDNIPDTDKVRFHANTTNRNGARFIGTKNGTTPEIGWSAIRIMHCEDKSYQSDYCGPEGPTYRR